MVNQETQPSTSPSKMLQTGHLCNDFSIYPRLLGLDSPMDRIRRFTEPSASLACRRASRQELKLDQDCERKLGSRGREASVECDFLESLAAFSKSSSHFESLVFECLREAPADGALDDLLGLRSEDVGVRVGERLPP